VELMTAVVHIQTDKLLKMQKRILWSTDEVRLKDIFNILHWEPIETTLKKREMIMTLSPYKLQGQLPECIVGRPRWQKVPLKRVDGKFMLEAGNRHFLIV
jgi:hypothetical protein